MSDERGSGGFDPAADDWLAEEGRIVWLDESEPTPADAPGTWHQSPREEAAGRVDVVPDEERTPWGDVIRRRRIVALAVLGAVVVAAIAVPVVVFGGGGGKHETTTTSPPANTTPVTTPQTTPTTTPTTPAKPTLKVTLPDGAPLRPGDTGAAVTTLQKALIGLGTTGLTADGSYGPATEAAVKAFQEANGLTGDGVVGPETAAKMNAELAANGVTA